MAHPERFERPTPRFVVWCSIQLSYGCMPDEKAGEPIQTEAGWQAVKRGAPTDHDGHVKSRHGTGNFPQFASLRALVGVALRS
jgi:hypothetical protein